MRNNEIPVLNSDSSGWPAGDLTAKGEEAGETRGCKVLFVNPPTIPYTYLVKGLANRYSGFEQIIAMPMGILYLSAVLERDMPGVEIRIVDLAKSIREYNSDPERTELDLEQFTSRVMAEQVPDDFVPDFVGISILFSTAHKSSIHIAAALKDRWANVPIVVGGMHATNAVAGLLESPDIDFICRGEAETTITKFAQTVLAGGDIQAIPGMIGRSKLDRGEVHESAPLIHDLDAIPFPAWHLINMPEYLHADHGPGSRMDEMIQDGVATIVTTRGCPFHCTFCASWTVHGRIMRYRSTENVIEELTQLKERYHVTKIIPEDDLFTVKKSRIIALCDAVTQTFGGSLYFEFPNGLSVATLDEDVIDAMARMGMVVANIAIESGSAYVQKHIIKKNVDLDRARRVVQFCRDTGIMVRTNFIFGFPGETREQMQQTIDFAASLPVDWACFNVAAPLVGTEMFEQLLEGGQIDQTFNWDEAFFAERRFDTPEIGAQELRDLTYSTNIRQNFFENQNLKIGEYERAINSFRDVLNHHRGHLVAQYSIGVAYKAMGNMAAYQEAMDRCLEMLSDSDYTMAHSHYQQFGDWLTELPEPSNEPALVETEIGPRPGMKPRRPF